MKEESGSCPTKENCEIKNSLEGKNKVFKTSMIADVHTDANTKKVLKMGTERIEKTD